MLDAMRPFLGGLDALHDERGNIEHELEPVGLRDFGETSVWFDAFEAFSRKRSVD